MKPTLTRSLSALGLALLGACTHTQVSTRLAPIPVDPALRSECIAPPLPGAGVTPSEMADYSLEAVAWGICEHARAQGLMAAIDAHNDTAND